VIDVIETSETAFDSTFRDNHAARPRRFCTYPIDRYYDPGTGQFLNVDPMVDQTGQAYAYTGGDPVNLTDPTGLAPYSYTFDLGLNGIAPSALASFLHATCSTTFALPGCTSNFEKGQTLPLKESIAGFTESFPVCVENIAATSFTFVALAGHPEGAGRAITFSFEQGKNGEDLLNVSTSSNGSLLTKPPLDIIDFPIAHETWETMANGFEWAYAQYEYIKQQGITSV